MPINNFANSIKSVANDIINNWIAGQMTNAQAICSFVNLILANGEK